MAKRLNDITIRLAGEAGQGVESGGAGFAKALSHGGLHLHAFAEYMSRIRGRLQGVGEGPPGSPRGYYDS